MAIKPNGKFVHIKEQIIEDPASGLTLMFSVYPCGTQSRLRVCGDALRHGNRDFIFGPTGGLGATGTATGGICKTSWLQEVPKETSTEREERKRRHQEKIEADYRRLKALDPDFEWGVLPETEETEDSN